MGEVRLSVNQWQVVGSRAGLSCDTPRSEKHQLQPGERDTHRERGREKVEVGGTEEKESERERESGENPGTFYLCFIHQSNRITLRFPLPTSCQQCMLAPCNK